jgi:hypothetical protein
MVRNQRWLSVATSGVSRISLNKVSNAKISRECNELPCVPPFLMDIQLDLDGFLDLAHILLG